MSALLSVEDGCGDFITTGLSEDDMEYSLQSTCNKHEVRLTNKPAMLFYQRLENYVHLAKPGPPPVLVKFCWNTAVSVRVLSGQRWGAETGTTWPTESRVFTIGPLAAPCLEPLGFWGCLFPLCNIAHPDGHARCSWGYLTASFRQPSGCLKVFVLRGVKSYFLKAIVTSCWLRDLMSLFWKFFFKQLYRGIITYNKIHPQNSISFNKCIEPCSHHYNPVLEQIHHPKEFPCPYLQSIPPLAPDS